MSDNNRLEARLSFACTSKMKLDLEQLCRDLGIDQSSYLRNLVSAAINGQISPQLAVSLTPEQLGYLIAITAQNGGVP